MDLRLRALLLAGALLLAASPAVAQLVTGQVLKAGTGAPIVWTAIGW